MGFRCFTESPVVQTGLLISTYYLTKQVSMSDNNSQERPRRSNQSWTKKEEKTLLDMFAAGDSYKDIAAALSRTESAIVSRISFIRTGGIMHEGTPYKPLPPVPAQRTEGVYTIVVSTPSGNLQEFTVEGQLTLSINGVKVSIS